jgi:hydroxyethylthiazole kinase-like uncharacterized protein yjeF
VYRIDALRAIEERCAGEPLMERAGAAAAEVARGLIERQPGPVVVLAGPGNNGGDGFVVARHLRAGFHDVVVVFRGDAGRLPRDAAAAHAAFVAAGGSTCTAPPEARPALVVDALFGIGLARRLPDADAALVRWANASGAPILALDIPTGLRAETGVATEPTIRACATATFIALKPGLLTGDGPDVCGDISVHALDIDPQSIAPSPGHALAWRALASALPAVLGRGRRVVHKGTFGTLGIVGGAPGMTGAALLAGRAAMRAGAGKVWVGLAAPERPAVDFGMPELMLREAGTVLEGPADAYVVGCGLATGATARALVERAIGMAEPLVLDADALTLVGSDAALRASVRARRAPTLATPHPAEAARLLGADVAGVQSDRLGAALAIAGDLRAHVVLKGAGSVIAHPDGTWDVNRSGNPALASAGTGDVLAGLIGAFLAQGIDAKQALRLAVCLHGAAADALVARGVGPLGVGASELPDVARELLNRAADAVQGTSSVAPVVPRDSSAR